MNSNLMNFSQKVMKLQIPQAIVKMFIGCIEITGLYVR